jgi:hypothetical protein
MVQLILEVVVEVVLMLRLPELELVVQELLYFVCLLLFIQELQQVLRQLHQMAQIQF